MIARTWRLSTAAVAGVEAVAVAADAADGRVAGAAAGDAWNGLVVVGCPIHVAGGPGPTQTERGSRR